jgi:putative ABC transport system permease protein
MKEGRFLQETDKGTNRCVISRALAKRLKKKLGETLSIDSVPLEIVGIYHTGMVLLDVAVILDIETVRKITRFDPGSVSSFYLEKSDDSLSDEGLKAAIENRFRGREIDSWQSTPRTGNLLFDALLWAASQSNAPSTAPEKKTGQAEKSSSQKDSKSEKLPIEVRSANDWGEKLAEFSKDLNIFLTIMTSIGISIAVLNIVNTMLMSVTERIVEFGILKANGWSRRDVLKLITFESAIVGVLGGVLGAFFGWVVTLVVNNTWPDRVNLFASPGLLLFGVVFSTFVGVLGGLYPAIWAMRMMPMDAIRRG